MIFNSSESDKENINPIDPLLRLADNDNIVFDKYSPESQCVSSSDIEECDVVLPFDASKCQKTYSTFSMYIHDLSIRSALIIIIISPPLPTSGRRWFPP